MSLLAPSGSFSVLRHRNFTFYLVARILGTLAVQMQSVAIGWQVYQLTGSLPGRRPCTIACPIFLSPLFLSPLYPASMKIHLLLHRFIRSRPHLSLAIALGVAVAVLLPDAYRWLTRVLIGWNAAVWPYLVTMGVLMMRADHAKVKAVAAKQDESAALVLATLSAAAVLSLTAIISELAGTHALPRDQRLLRYGFTVLTLFGSWFLVGLLFCFHYAHQFYRAPAGAPPLQFPDHERQPDYWDFLYFSFTIAVAVQTSDVAVMTRPMRKLVLGQSLLSFFFNLVILGLSINIGAGMISD
jgi:uncharacterized membrane protein